MIAFINTFITYLILVIASVAIIIAGVLCGKKLRQVKDSKSVEEEIKEEK